MLQERRGSPSTDILLLISWVVTPTLINPVFQGFNPKTTHPLPWARFQVNLASNASNTRSQFNFLMSFFLSLEDAFVKFGSCISNRNLSTHYVDWRVLRRV